jgi:uncharacterized low-complexity protein
MKKPTLVTLAAGSLLAATLSPAHAAAGNPFEATRLDAGYQVAQADKKKDGKCGEAKCGSAKPAGDKKKDGSCGGKKPEASCGAKK